MTNERYVELGARLNAHLGISAASTADDVLSAFMRSVKDARATARAIGVSLSELSLWQFRFVAIHA